MRTESPRVAPTQGQRAAGQLNRGSEVVALLLCGSLAASARECVGVCESVWGPHHICGRLSVHRRVDDVVWGKSTAVAATKLGCCVGICIHVVYDACHYLAVSSAVSCKEDHLPTSLLF